MAAIEHPVIAELDNLNSTIGRLSAEIKAKQSIIKDLNEQVRLAELDARAKIEATQARVQARTSELETLLAPLEAKRQLIAEADQAIAKRKQLLEDETARLKHERQQALATVSVQVNHESARLDKIQHAIAQCKAIVAGV